MEDAGRALAQRVRVVMARGDAEFEPAFATLNEERAGALIVNRDGFFNSRREQMRGARRRHAVPAVYESREHVVAGLMTYKDKLLEDTGRPASTQAVS